MKCKNCGREFKKPDYSMATYCQECKRRSYANPKKRKIKIINNKNVQTNKNI